jgi:hypothetical protein
VEFPSPRSRSQLRYYVNLARRDLISKMEAGGPLQDIHRELHDRQGGKCSICSFNLTALHRTVVRRKIAPWEIAASELCGEEVCRLANHKDNLLLVHRRCWWGTCEMEKRSKVRVNPASVSSNASIRSADTNTPGVPVLHPIEAAARDPLKNP